MNRVMVVKCINIRKAFPEQIKIGELYFLNPDTIFIDADGDATATIYADRALLKEIGNLQLNHFYTIDKNY